MAIPKQVVLGVLLAFSGCVGGGNGGGGAPGTVAPQVLPAPVGETLAGGNQVHFEVDGQAYAFRTPEVRHSRSRVGEQVVAHSFELANPDNSLYARMVLNVAEDLADLSGEYAAVSLGDPDQHARAGVGEVVLAEEANPSRGRRMLPSGSGVIVVEQRSGRLRVRFETRGDGLFREAAAAPVTGTLDFHWQP
ncbi:hypothetical protein GCM10011521_10110 [Arenimonas soli]|uniref:Uncharacterized protein n=1 Tax=Arenimonas soli TaxID=2269504 RepID=A0ABQ1HEH0_9GAMM|nr:hypothetical protein [Arenimonas soli]GGA73928.1 hypothetical protein GCM10011521_10110 [Arenimonas soli]